MNKPRSLIGVISFMIRNFVISEMDKVIDIWLTVSIKAHDFIEKSFWESKVIDMKEQVDEHTGHL